MKIAIFNINGVNKRLDNLLAWLGDAAPDDNALVQPESRASVAQQGWTDTLRRLRPSGPDLLGVQAAALAGG